MNVQDPYPVPSGRVARGTLRPPASKSVSQRHLDLALVLDVEDLTVDNLLFSDDIRHFLGGIEACGLAVESTGTGARVRRGTPPTQEVRIDCGAGGTMYRFFVAALCVRTGTFVLDGTSRLRERPIGPLVDALRQLGARIEYLGESGHCPLRIHGDTLDGGRCELDASLSSQYLSALLMAGLRARHEVEIAVTGMTSAPYVTLTLEAIDELGLDAVRVTEKGYRVTPVAGDVVAPGRVLQVEADDSAVAYPAAAALLTGGEVVLQGLKRSSSQGDRRLLDLLEEVGAGLAWSADELCVTRVAETLRPFDVDMSEIPDQVPTMAAIAPFCDGTSRIRNVPHLRIKESDRLSAMAEGLTRCGFEVREEPDGLVLEGSREIPTEPARVEIATHEDHRIAMAMSLVGLKRSGVWIQDPGVVAKSYPDYWRHLESLLAP